MRARSIAISGCGDAERILASSSASTRLSEPLQPIITSAAATAPGSESLSRAVPPRVATKPAARPEEEKTEMSVQPRSRSSDMVAPA